MRSTPLTQNNLIYLIGTKPILSQKFRISSLDGSTLRSESKPTTHQYTHKIHNVNVFVRGACVQSTDLPIQRNNTLKAQMVTTTNVRRSVAMVSGCSCAYTKRSSCVIIMEVILN